MEPEPGGGARSSSGDFPPPGRSVFLLSSSSNPGGRTDFLNMRDGSWVRGPTEPSPALDGGSGDTVAAWTGSSLLAWGLSFSTAPPHEPQTTADVGYRLNPAP